MKFDRYYRGATLDLKRLVKDSWRTHGLPYELCWEDFLEELPRPRHLPENARRFGAKFIDQIMIFDLAACYFLHLRFGAMISLMEGPEARPRDQALASISAHAWSYLLAVRHLALAGLDVQAKQLARGLSESLDALCLASLSDEFCSAFVDDQGSNGAWFRHIAKGKAQRAIYQAVASRFGQSVASGLTEYRKVEEEVLSSSAHPTHIAGFISGLPHFGDRTASTFADDRMVSVGSVRTVHYCAIRALEVMANDLSIFGNADRIANRIEGELNGLRFDGLRTLVLSGRRCAGTLLRYLFENLDSYQPDVDLGASEMAERST